MSKIIWGRFDFCGGGWVKLERYTKRAYLERKKESERGGHLIQVGVLPERMLPPDDPWKMPELMQKLGIEL